MDNLRVPFEILSDPNCWVSAQEMEEFLSQISSLSQTSMEVVGHKTPELHAWGILDSVLKMMPRPQEMWVQPERFLGYFISPQPPIAQVQRTESTLEFDIPIPTDQFPLVTTYLRAAFESLPLYIGPESAQVTWQGIRVKMDWSTQQNSMFSLDQDPGYQISPDLLRSVVVNLEKTSRELEEKNFRLEQRNAELLRAQSELEKQLKSKLHLTEQIVSEATTQKFSALEISSAEGLRQEMGRLNDYMTRALQLIQILSFSEKQNTPAKEALRRMDWEKVPGQFQQTVKNCFQIIDSSLRSPSCQKSSAYTPVKSSTAEEIQPLKLM